MSDTTPFDADLGGAQGLVDSSLVLGARDDGRYELVAVGDYFEVSQTADLSAVGASLFYATSITMARGRAQGDLRWVLVALVGGVERWRLDVFDREDYWVGGIVASALGGDEEFSFRLLLTGTPGTYLVRLPLVAFGAFSAFVGQRPYLTNLTPRYDAERVARGAVVYLTVVDPETDGVDVAETEVYVEGALAFAAGVFVAPFDGPESSSAVGPDGRSLLVAVDYTGLFDAESVVHVRVVSLAVGQLVGGLDETYSFTVEDVTPPTMRAAVAYDHTTVYVSFNEPMLDDPSASGSVTNPQTWLVQGTGTSVADGLPAYPVNVIGATLSADGLRVELALDAELTPGAPYRAVASGAKDLQGNFLEGDQQPFTGYVCGPPDRRFRVYDLLPQMNRSEDRDGTRDLEAFCACLQDQLDLILCSIDRWRDVFDPLACPEDFLDLMLYELGNPFELSMTLAQKRRLATNIYSLMSKKGTDAAVVEFVRFFLGVEVSVVTVWYDGIWILGKSHLDVDTVLGDDDRRLRYSYKVVCATPTSAEEVSQIAEIAAAVAPAHTHLIAVEQPP